MVKTPKDESIVHATKRERVSVSLPISGISAPFSSADLKALRQEVPDGPAPMIATRFFSVDMMS